MSDDKKARHKSESEALKALFIALLAALRGESEEEALYELAELRTELAFAHVLDGLGIDVEEARQLIKNIDDNSLSQRDVEMRKRLVAALSNLIDFCVCEEYQLYDETRETLADKEVDYNSDEYLELLALCEKYNDKYAAVENGDIEYSGVIAARWLTMSARDYLIYWTQNDAKVRPWHMELQGYAAHRDEFPSWMIPPIEYNCRCFLECLEVPYVEAKVKEVKGSGSVFEKPVQISDVYSESLAKCGRIFGPSHSYFTVKSSDSAMLERLVKRLKDKYYG